MYLFGPNLKAQWWLIDDHEIFYFLKTEKKPSSWLDFFGILIDQTEVGQFGSSSRYRISYYSLRLIETILWKDNVFLWYAFRMGIAMLFSFSILRIFTRYFSLAISILFLLSVFSFRYWSDIFSRLGTGEVYAVLGVALILISLTEYDFRNKNQLWIYIFIFLGVVIASGSKENFIVLILLPISILFIERSQSSNWSKRSILICSILFNLVTFTSLYLFFNKSKVDVYGNSVLLSDRISMLLTRFENEFVLNMVALIGGILSFGSLFYIREKRNIISPVLAIPFVFLGILLFNILFYNGIWPTQSRYDFPGILVYQAGLFLLLYLNFESFLKFTNIQFDTMKLPVQGILMLLLVSFVSIKGMNNLQKDSRANMKRTISFQTSLNEIKSDSTSDTIILYVHQALDFEPVDSFIRFLNYFENDKPKMVSVTATSAESEFKNGLLNSMRSLSKLGSPELKILPLDFERLKGKSCLLVYFPPATIENLPKISGCKSLSSKIVSF
ncbi:hypothetical protein EHQ76_13950 [Leptospira barantonii]|uniref:Glycosyltransferase RgtA/B/C/D-like domain-containing protein n=1 Tax=Leptospira barantonii TaxID=2023184 RepID=A0A5F2B115_9LEPT|nr:hypothetical protein [Leptospira barantonii]TGL98127.1 hypothetical protein EHQ76_13950 [Leptospira barantonii]